MQFGDSLGPTVSIELLPALKGLSLMHFLNKEVLKTVTFAFVPHFVLPLKTTWTDHTF